MSASDTRLRYRFWRVTARIVLTLLFRPRYYGLEKVPASGGVLLCMNHECYLDPFFVGMALRARTLWFLAMKPLWRSRVLGYLLSHHWNGLPVDQKQLDLSTFRAVKSLLKDGKAIMLFPEGERTRDGKMNRGRKGAGLIVARARVPVVPIRIIGGHEAWPRGGRLRPRRVTLKFGDPIDFTSMLEQADGDKDLVYQQIADRIMHEISQLSADDL
jgi:1-acyl-sn-glycerol-3-phosphate acyltransferase